MQLQDDLDKLTSKHSTFKEEFDKLTNTQVQRYEEIVKSREDDLKKIGE